jgi:acyl-CoA thioesterase I
MSIKVKSIQLLAGAVVASLMIGCGGGERNQEDAGFPDAGRADAVGVESSLDGSGEAGRAGTAGSATGDLGPRGGADVSSEALSTVLFVGTSLTAGQGLPDAQSFPMLIQQRIDQAELPFRVVNAGVSGETSAGALRRVDWLLQQEFDVLVLETGANDMLRGMDPAATERNIQEIVDRVRRRRPTARIVLAGMMALPNLGPEYVRQFAAVYPRLAERNDLVLIPFLLDGVAAERELNQGDGVHPNAAGQRVVAETVWEVLEPVLRADRP